MLQYSEKSGNFGIYFFKLQQFIIWSGCNIRVPTFKLIGFPAFRLPNSQQSTVPKAIIARIRENHMVIDREIEQFGRFQ